MWGMADSLNGKHCVMQTSTHYCGSVWMPFWGFMFHFDSSKRNNLKTDRGPILDSYSGFYITKNTNLRSWLQAVEAHLSAEGWFSVVWPIIILAHWNKSERVFKTNLMRRCYISSKRWHWVFIKGHCNVCTGFLRKIIFQARSSSASWNITCPALHTRGWSCEDLLFELTHWDLTGILPTSNEVYPSRSLISCVGTLL